MAECMVSLTLNSSGAVKVGTNSVISLNSAKAMFQTKLIKTKKTPLKGIMKKASASKMLMKKMLEKIPRPQANLRNIRMGMVLRLKEMEIMYNQPSTSTILLT